MKINKLLPASLITALVISVLLIASCNCATTTTVSVIVGSSDGSAHQIFALSNVPITTIEIWVNEVDALSEEEIAHLDNKAELEVKSIQDERGNTIEFWVKWQETDDLLKSSGNDRHYERDTDSGTIRFGDGEHGARPPTGQNNIKANYRLGGSTTVNSSN